MIDEIYQDVILDHYQHPRHKRIIPDPDCRACLLNPLCGDKVEVAVKMRGGLIDQIAFQGHGCAISQACASIMSELCKGRSPLEIEKLRELFRKMVLSTESPGDLTPLGDAALFSGVRKIPARRRCALLAWEALERCLLTYSQDRKESQAV